MWENTPEEIVATLKSGGDNRFAEAYIADLHSTVTYFQDLDVFDVELHRPSEEPGMCEILPADPFANEEEVVKHLKSFRDAHEKTMTLAALMGMLPQGPEVM